MRRSICLCEPQTILAGDVSNWKFVYTTATPLPKGARLKFDLLSKGRNIDWQIPQADLKKNSNVIYGYIDEAKPIAARAVEAADSIVPQFEFTLPSELKMGQSFVIVLGAPPKSSANAKQGNMCQTNIQRRRPFYLYIDPKGNGKYEDPEIFTLDIRGNKLDVIQILTPSIVTRNKRFDIIVRFEDKFGNLTNNAPTDTLVELYYEHLRENLNWKLFVPETGFVTLPNLYFNEEGVYKIQLRNLKTGEKFVSSPIKCFSENHGHLFWGLLHGESERVDSSENIENCLRHFRDERALNFFGTSSFDSLEETPNEIWKAITQCIGEFNEEDRFSTLLGFQWMGESPAEGLRQFVYVKDGKPILRQKEIKSNALKKIYKTLSPKEAIAIPCFTMGKGVGYDFEDFSPEFERVVEIYNAWGSSECTAAEGNPRPITFKGKRGMGAMAEGSIQKALEKNCRFGFVGGGLDDRGIYADFYDSDQVQYSPGLTAILATTHTREALMEALHNRSCYATTGQRIILGIYLAGQPMGSELNTKAKPGLAIHRHFSGYVAGTSPLQKIEIIRNGKVVKCLQIKDKSFTQDFTYDENDDLAKISFPAKGEKPPFLYYYLRVFQEDGHIAWSSPIWLDYFAEAQAEITAAKKKVKKVKK